MWSLIVSKVKRYMEIVRTRHSSTYQTCLNLIKSGAPNALIHGHFSFDLSRFSAIAVSFQRCIYSYVRSNAGWIEFLNISKRFYNNRRWFFTAWVNSRASHAWMKKTSQAEAGFLIKKVLEIKLTSARY